MTDLGIQGIYGARQTLRALRNGRVVCVYVAEDAAPVVTEPVITAAEAAGIPVETVPSMKELGRICGLPVDCACAARTAK